LQDLAADRKLALDVTHKDSVDAAVEAAGDIDVLVFTAGVIFHAALEAACSTNS
jgi:NADP-dependent 3-hydroxy acid dehydrogenase YdfG